MSFILSNIWKRSRLISEDNTIPVYEGNIQNYIEKIYTMKDPSIVLENIDDIKEEDKSIIKETIDNILFIDKIKHNHDILYSKFHYNDTIRKYKCNGPREAVREFAKFADNYKIPEYKKMNLVIEEMCYIASKEGFSYDINDIIDSVVEYYLLNTNEDRSLLKKVCENNILCEDYNYDYIDKKEISIDGINSLIESIKLDTNYEELNERVYTTIKNTRYTDLEYNLSKLIEVFDHIDNCDKESIMESIENAILDREDLNKDKLLKAYKSSQFPGLLEKAIYVYGEDNLDAIKYVNSDNGNIIMMNEFKIVPFNGLIRAVFTLDRKLAQKERLFLNKLRTRRFKKAKSGVGNKNLTAALFGEAADMRNNIYSYIGQDAKADVCVRQYYIENTEDLYDITQTFESIIKEVNTELELNRLDNIRAYYLTTESIIEFHVKCRDKIGCTIEDVNKIRESTDTSMQLYIDIADSIQETYNKYKDLSVNNIHEYLESISECNNFTEEHLNLVIEAAKFIGIPKEEIEELCARYSDTKFSNSKSVDIIKESNKLDIKIKSILEEYEIYEDCDIDIQLEAFSLLIEIFKLAGLDSITEESMDDKLKKYGYDPKDDKKEEDDEDDEDDEDEDDDEEDTKKKSSKSNKKKPSEIAGKGDDIDKEDAKKKTGFSLNNVKLALHSLKAKLSKLSGKEKEISHNLDHSMSSFVNNLRKAQSDEKREQIIKGQVLPSFSKCIKFGIVLVGLGIASQGIVVPAIAALGGFALNKTMTNREKALVLDELETEMEVIDKELAIADSNNQINKYRALLKYKKEIQRQYQRIKYNVRVGRDSKMFSASTGTPSGN